MLFEQAVLYNPQTWRHHLASAALQLDIKKGVRTEMGHWKPGSSNPHHYGTVMFAIELWAKEKARRAIAQDWDLVGPGCISAEVVEAMKTSPNTDLTDSEDEDETPLVALSHPDKRPKLQISESDEKVSKSESLQVMKTILVFVLSLVFKILMTPRLWPPKGQLTCAKHYIQRCWHCMLKSFPRPHQPVL